MYSTTTAPAHLWTVSDRLELQREARSLGAFGATYQPKAIGHCLPATATLRDCRDRVALDFIQSCDKSVHWLLPDLLAGFDHEADSRYSPTELRQDRAPIAAGAGVWCVDDEGAEGWLTVGREYVVQAARAGGWLCITDDSGDAAAWHHACHFVPA